jgi:hypothetical protein
MVTLLAVALLPNPYILRSACTPVAHATAVRIPSSRQDRIPYALLYRTPDSTTK